MQKQVDFDTLDPRRYIMIKGARLHNLKNIDVVLPRYRFIVITGVSGSGKSSLTIDTLYAEGQRRYVESLSSYARQFLGRMNKPDVDYIKGISPAIAIEQKVFARGARSTVGTLTEIFDYLRLLYARIGKTYDPISGKLVKKDEVSDIGDFVWAMPTSTRVYILFALPPKAMANLQKELQILTQKGYSRVFFDEKMTEIEDLEATKMKISPDKPFYVVVDRLVLSSDDEDLKGRLLDSIATAFFEGLGKCTIWANDHAYHFSNVFEADGIVFEQPTPHFFNFNSPSGACPRCEGFGNVVDIDPDLVIPNPALSVYEDAIAPWRTEKMSAWKDQLIRTAHKFDFPIHRAIKDLSAEQYDLLWTGNKHFSGLQQFFNHLEAETHKIQYRVILAKYRGKTTCRECNGARLKKEVQYVKIGDKSIADLLVMPIKELKTFFEVLQLNDYEQAIAGRAIVEIKARLTVMCKIGLEYLNLNRSSATLSGGETQRINLTRSLGSNLTNSMYILDEPSVGLHPRDTQRLIEILQQLRNLGNSVIVVEHEEAIMKAADYLIDIGPLAGVQGGEVVFAGTPASLIHAPDNSLTAQYLTGKKQLPLPQHRRRPTEFIVIKNAYQHNLKNITARFPLHAISVVTGVSGSGKTTLVKQILYPALKRQLENSGDAPGKHELLEGRWDSLGKVELIDQNPLGRSSRSNPVTYIKAYDSIRDLFAKLPISRLRGFAAKHFSFNVEGGRCEACQGEGEIVVEMQFLADIRLQCEDCKGRRFKQEVLEAAYKNKNIFEVLDMTIDEALEFFADTPDVATRLLPLSEVGLGYIKLGQSTGTLSGGEAQRVKLASYLGKGKTNTPILFIFDEPSTGLHFNDILKLMAAFNALVECGHTIVIVEHNLDIIKCADWVLDLGPEGGDQGGYLLYEGAPEGLPACKESYTATFLGDKIK